MINVLDYFALFYIIVLAMCINVFWFNFKERNFFLIYLVGFSISCVLKLINIQVQQIDEFSILFHFLYITFLVMSVDIFSINSQKRMIISQWDNANICSKPVYIFIDIYFRELYIYIYILISLKKSVGWMVRALMIFRAWKRRNKESEETGVDRPQTLWSWS